MGELREIVEVAAVERWFVLLAIAGPILGAVIGGARRRLAAGLLIGMLGPLNWLLWRIYNLLTDRNGLDSVANLLINLAMFVVVGGLIGAGIGLALRRAPSPTSDKGDTP